MDLYLKEGNHTYFNALINNMVQFLSSRDDIKRFRVKGPKRLDNDERLRFTAQIYNASLQPSTDSDITLKLTTPKSSNRIPFSTEGYVTSDRKLDAGEYKWHASTLAVIKTLRNTRIKGKSRIIGFSKSRLPKRIAARRAEPL